MLLYNVYDIHIIKIRVTQARQGRCRVGVGSTLSAGAPAGTVNWTVGLQ